MNVITLVGRLGRDPEVKTLTTGTLVAEFTMAVNKRFKPKDGGPDADWFRVKTFGKSAEFVENYITKGRLVAVTGRMESRKYQDKDGNNREAWEVVAEDVRGLDKAQDGAAPATARASATAANTTEEYDPFAQGEDA